MSIKNTNISNSDKPNDFVIEETDLDTIIDIDEPDLFKVVLLNDDYTTMEFVIEILERIFSKTANDATAIMMNIHSIGKGVCGIYTYDIAETKVSRVREISKKSGFPLRAEIEKD